MHFISWTQFHEALFLFLFSSCPLNLICILQKHRFQCKFWNDYAVTISTWVHFISSLIFSVVNVSFEIMYNLDCLIYEILLRQIYHISSRDLLWARKDRDIPRRLFLRVFVLRWWSASRFIDIAMWMRTGIRVDMSSATGGPWLWRHICVKMTSTCNICKFNGYIHIHIYIPYQNVPFASVNLCQPSFHINHKFAAYQSRTGIPWRNTAEGT